jgi:hypothetical protein
VNEQNPVILASDQPKDQKTKIEDHSSKYNVSDAIKKLRSLKSIDEIFAFTKGDSSSKESFELNCCSQGLTIKYM